MENKMYYLVFAVDRLPDLTLTKYSVFDGSSVDDIMDKHGVFLRQLHRLGSTSGVYFHLLYYYNPDERIQKGYHLSVIFYATSTEKERLEGIREFLTSSVLSTYYDFHCFEVSDNFDPAVIITTARAQQDKIKIIGDMPSSLRENDVISEYSVCQLQYNGVQTDVRIIFGKRIQLIGEKLRIYADKDVLNHYDEFELGVECGNSIYNCITSGMVASEGDMFICYTDTSNKSIIKIEQRSVQTAIELSNVAGQNKLYGINEKDIFKVKLLKKEVTTGLRPSLCCEIASDADAVLGFNRHPTNPNGQVIFPQKYVLAKSAHIMPSGVNRNGIENKLLWLFEDDSPEAYNEPYYFSGLSPETVQKFESKQTAKSGEMFVCFFAPDTNLIVDIRSMKCDENKPISFEENQIRKFQYAAYLTKKDYYLPAQNLFRDETGEVPLYSIMEWEPCENGRLYNVLKLMEGYNRTAALRVDIFPVEHTQKFRNELPYADTRRRIAERAQGKDDNSENIIKSWDKYLQNLMKFPQFLANVVAFADSEDIAVMLVDSVAAEAVESGTYLVENLSSQKGFDVYFGDNYIFNRPETTDNYVHDFLSLYTLEEIRPMFSLPILYPGESIECLKETDPKPFTEKNGESISLGVSSLGYDVEFPVKLFKKHAFIAGVPGAGKTNTMLHLVTSLWRDTEEQIPFLVLEPAKQEYRALANISGMEKLRIFSPGADTYFPLHINPFQFPVGLTLAEHIANLNAVFAGAFELPPPSPHFIDTCIEKVYLDKGWNVNERNELNEDGTYKHEFPTLQELYASLEVAVKNSHYQGETLGNLQSVLEVRVGSLLKREIGNVYNVRESIVKPEEWLDIPAIIELEALGEGPANFMSLLLSTLIRETLKVRKTSNVKKSKKTLNHVIFYEEAHNLIGPDTDSPMGDSVDPKISATKYVVKMLAEVRALNEGIVIADQLPTVMAPEVLKNTGLKIAHRITAQDDRGLLGSTMSATADQLEEQGTFATGWALIFYEDLLKPYKMKVHEWDAANQDKDKYESMANDDLRDALTYNLTYLELLNRSKSIMETKIASEYALLQERAKKLKKSLNDEVMNLLVMERGIKNQEAGLNSLKNDAYKTAMIEIQKQRLAYDDKIKWFQQKYGRELTTLCWDFSTQYFATITLAESYTLYDKDPDCNRQKNTIFSDYLSVCSICGFLSLFETMRSLSDCHGLSEILVEQTQSAMQHIARFVSFNPVVDGSLSKHPSYGKLLHASAYYWFNYIHVKKNEMVAKADRIVKWMGNRETAIVDFCRDWTNCFLDYYGKADIYADATWQLVLSKESKAEEYAIKDPDKYESLIKQATELKERRFALYKILCSYVTAPFSILQELRDDDRVTLLKATNVLRNQFREIVDYDGLYRPAKAKLSDSSNYKMLRERASKIAVTEMNARFNIFHIALNKAEEDLITADTPEKKQGIIKSIGDKYNGYFLGYAEDYDVELYSFRLCLVGNYMKYLDKVMDWGIWSKQYLLSDPSRQRVIMCNRIIQELEQEHVIPEDTWAQWIRILQKWTKYSAS